MKKKGLLIFLILTLAFSLALAGCASENGSEQKPDETKETGDGEKKEDAKKEQSKPKVLIFARGGDSVSLDPATTTDGETSRVTRQIFESLLEFDADSFKVGPGLAESWDIEDNGSRYILHLRKGVKFHDGTDFNADAVIANFERWSDKSNPYHFADQGLSYVFYGNQFGGLQR